MDCVFCSISVSNYILENEHFFVIEDKHPVSKGHLLIISKRHFEDYFGISAEESVSLRDITLKAREHLISRYSPVAFNLGMNCGSHAGQSVFHFHLHLIPRYTGERRSNLRGLREFIRNTI
ncbi:MAG TPA: HIT family protein [Candidatus Cloacimonadota bacterium]|nr:HIT family protein [Candidatus Cloacimonadota bacterium]HPS38126.1 HIT family protein [Candidatus Cloacimonadota bacterium]